MVLPTLRPPQGEPPALPYEGDPEDLPIRRAAHAAVAGPWPPDLTAAVRAYWDSRAPDWTQNMGPFHTDPLEDAIDRLEAAPSAVLELGAGTGLGTRALERLLPAAFLVATDLSPAMARRTRLEGTRSVSVAADSTALPFTPRSFDLVVLFNTYLFPQEVRRVLTPGAAVVAAWSLGPATPIYVTAGEAETALGGEAVTAAAGWGAWWRITPGRSGTAG